MPNLLAFDPNQFVAFILIFIRITGVFVVAPIFGDRNIPVQIKAVIAFVLALLFFPLLPTQAWTAQVDVTRLIYLGGIELAVGLTIGFVARLIFTSIALAGEIIGLQMGLSIANIFDPSTGGQVALIGQFKLILALLLFVTLNGHHLLIKALIDSYSIIPPGELVVKSSGSEFMIDRFHSMFVLALRIGAPLIVSLLAANVSMGLLNRAVPQINIMIVGLPFTIIIGIIILGLGMPYFINMIANWELEIYEIIRTALTALSNGS